jgi:uncharacterized protein (TIGR00725 family)
MKTIAIAAYSGPPSERHASAARIIIGELSRYCLDDVVIAVGGYWGLMKTIVDEALSHGFRVVVYPYAEREDLDYPGEAIVVKTGLTPEARSILLVRSGDILIALGGGVGTMIEVLLAYSMGKPVYLLKTGLASDKLEVFAPYIDERRLAELKVYEDPVKLARDACLFLASQRTPSLKSIHG